MAILILGLVIFLGGHAFTMLRGPRNALVAQFGTGGYKAAYTVVALIGLALIFWGYGLYRNSGYIPVWEPPRGLSHLSLLLMIPAFIALAASGPPGEIKRRLKHPMITAVKIWAVAHLIANGDLGSMILFTSFLAWGVMARISMKKRDIAAGGSVAASISPGWKRQDTIAVAAGVLAYVAFVFWLHPLLIGVRVVGG